MCFYRNICIVLIGSVLCAISHGYDWSAGSWRIDVAGSGTPGTETCPMYYPGDGMGHGNALMVYYEVAEGHFPQMWVFLTDGFFRQVSPSNTYGTSYRMFRYWSSEGEMCDVSKATSFTVTGTNSAGELVVELNYSNIAECGDRFNVNGTAFLEPPQGAQAAMRLEVSVTNASGYSVEPSMAMRRDLVDQWWLFGVSSMYVADHFSGGLPDWYDGQDSSHRYVGSLYDGDFFNDGFSQNGQFEVSTHDIRDITFAGTSIQLSHDESICPHLVIPNYTWYGELVAMYETSTYVRVDHAFDSAKTHNVTVTNCGGLVKDVDNINWAVTFNRYDGNMVDGDNVQIKLSLDDAVNAWPAGGVQTVGLRLTAGTTNFAVVKVPCAAKILPATNSLLSEAQWQVNGETWCDAGEVAAVVPGVYTVTVNEVEGWVKPRWSKVVTVPGSSLYGATMQYVEFPEVPQPVTLTAFALTNSVMLRWQDPMTCGYSNRNVIVRAATNDYPQSVSVGRSIYEGDTNDWHDTDLLQGETQYYTLFVTDDGTNYFEPAQR